jgi:hypothetical protein
MLVEPEKLLLLLLSGNAFLLGMFTGAIDSFIQDLVVVVHGNDACLLSPSHLHNPSRRQIARKQIGSAVLTRFFVTNQLTCSLLRAPLRDFSASERIQFASGMATVKTWDYFASVDEREPEFISSSIF